MVAAATAHRHDDEHAGNESDKSAQVHDEACGIHWRNRDDCSAHDQGGDDDDDHNDNAGLARGGPADDD